VSSSHQDLWWKALSLIKGASSPVGAWRLSKLLSESGVDVSEATCGRLLRDLEDKGFLRSAGRSGRVVTPQGDKALEEWEKGEARTKSHAAFMESLKIGHIGELIDVLVARRAIEGETAALAAAKATEEDIETLRTVIREHEELLAHGSSGAEKDTEFHRALAIAGKNRVLASALDVIHHDPDVGRALEYIRARVGSRMVEDHRSILNEVERKNPLAARRAMERHIANLIKDVGSFWAGKGLPRGGNKDEGHGPDLGWL